jgi:predicted dehydrogenase
MTDTAAVHEPSGSALSLEYAPKRLGFLGVGWIGLHRLTAVVQSGVAQVVAVADADPAAAAHATHVAPHAVVASSLNALLELDLDGIVIATPSAIHASQAIAALENGKAVFCQKPLARTAPETRQIVEAARQANRLLGVDFSYRFVRGIPQIQRLVQRGELGTIYAIDLVFHNAYGPDKPWFYNPELSGGGCMIDLGVHLVDLALWLLNFPAVDEVSSRLYTGGSLLALPTAHSEDYAVAQIGLHNGATIRLACSWKLPAGRDAVIELFVYGTEGGASLRNVDGSFYDFVIERFNGTSTEPISTPPDEWGGRAIIDWAEQLAAGARYDGRAEQFIDVATVVDKIYGR